MILIYIAIIGMYKSRIIRCHICLFVVMSRTASVLLIVEFDWSSTPEVA